ncbi:hypothetical protein DPMN_104106 [Dreissena polymorpha]|uniref:Uncharacterized protein n=1 Tax=Dreissena polymorpha TaxID=45954 RepID=A0A9D4HB00_DREPO|nr:hypothetical protein DPMN_104106 [Dreissena polymorpha]
MSTGSSVYNGSVDMSEEDIGKSKNTSDVHCSAFNNRRAKRKDRHMTSTHNGNHADVIRNASLRLMPVMSLGKPSSASTSNHCNQRVSKTRIIAKAEDRRQFLEINNAKSVYVGSSVVHVNDSDSSNE